MQFLIAFILIAICICLQDIFKLIFDHHDKHCNNCFNGDSYSDKVHKYRIKQMREADKKQKKRERARKIENKYFSNLKKRWL